MSNHQANSTHGHEGFPWKHIWGFVFSLVLTVLALWFVFSTSLPTSAVITAIVTLALFQALVQLLLFMHLTESNMNVYQVIAIIFGFFIGFVVVGFSIWIMTFKSIVS